MKTWQKVALGTGAVGLAVFALWRFWPKTKKRDEEKEEEEEQIKPSDFEDREFMGTSQEGFDFYPGIPGRGTRGAACPPGYYWDGRVCAVMVE